MSRRLPPSPQQLGRPASRQRPAGGPPASSPASSRRPAGAQQPGSQAGPPAPQQPWHSGDAAAQHPGLLPAAADVLAATAPRRRLACPAPVTATGQHRGMARECLDCPASRNSPPASRNSPRTLRQQPPTPQQPGTPPPAIQQGGAGPPTPELAGTPALPPPHPRAPATGLPTSGARHLCNGPATREVLDRPAPRSRRDAARAGTRSTASRRF